MPSSVASALFIFGAVLTSLTAAGGVIVAALGLLWELGVFYLSGSNAPG